MKRFFRVTVIVLAAVFLAIQLVPVERTNPPVTSPLVAPEPVRSILARACNDCHSNETRWPWYAYVAPMSWLVTKDVVAGRKHLNLSEWGGFSADKRSSKADSMAEEVEKGEMPLSNYVLIHHDAKLSPADAVALRDWADDVE